MKKTARILTVVFTVVALFGSTLTAQAATVKSNKKVKYYKTASAKKKAGTFKKATKLTAISMAKGFVKFKKGSKNLYIKVADVKISGKYTAKVSKKTKVYNKKLKATKTVLKKNKSLTISGMKVKKKVAYLKYAAGKFVKATDVKVTSFAPAPAPSDAPATAPATVPATAPATAAPTVAPTTAPVDPTVAPVDPTAAPTEDNTLGPNLVPAEKASFDYWANGAHQGESLSSSDHTDASQGYSITDGYGKLANGDPRPNNYTYNLNADTGATYGHWNFGAGYGNDTANGIQGLTKGVTYEISFEYYAPFENDFVVQNLYNTADKEIQTNLLPGGTQQILVATDEWQTFKVRAEFQGIFLMNFGMWNPMADTEVGVFIDNFSIKAVLDTIPTAAPAPTPAPTEDVDGVLTYDKTFTATDYTIAMDQAYGGSFTWSAAEYALAVGSGYSHVIFNSASGYSTVFPSSGTYRVVINGKFSPSSVAQTDAMSYSTEARREKTEADGLGDGESVGPDGKIYKDGQVVYLNGNNVKDHESYSQVKPITTNTADEYSNHVFDIEVKEGANEFMLHLIPGYLGETNYLRSMQIYKLNN